MRSTLYTQEEYTDTERGVREEKRHRLYKTRQQREREGRDRGPKTRRTTT